MYSSSSCYIFGVAGGSVVVLDKGAPITVCSAISAREIHLKPP